MNLRISVLHRYIVSRCIEIVNSNIGAELKCETIFQWAFRRDNEWTYGNFVHRYHWHNRYHHHRPTNVVYIDPHNQIVYPNIVNTLDIHPFYQLIPSATDYLLQFRSSDESLQSTIRLQRQEDGMQRPPVSHLHSLMPHASNRIK